MGSKDTIDTRVPEVSVYIDYIYLYLTSEEREKFSKLPNECCYEQLIPQNEQHDTNIADKVIDLIRKDERWIGTNPTTFNEQYIRTIITENHHNILGPKHLRKIITKGLTGYVGEEHLDLWVSSINTALKIIKANLG